MKRIDFVAAAAVVGGLVGFWQLGARLSPDALGMMVGLCFGALAGVPAALLTAYALRDGAPRAEPPTRIDRIVIVERQSIVRGSTSYDPALSSPTSATARLSPSP